MKKIYFALLMLVCCFPITVSAQATFKTGYFIDGYNYRHQLNPAFASSRSYFSIPSIGNLNITTQSNVGLNTFLYPHNGQLTTFLNGNVSAEQFLGQLKKNNRLGVGLNVPVFTVGAFGKLGGFTTVELNVRANANANIPYDLFSFAKNIGSQSHYEITGLGVNASAYLELAIGHAHKLTDNLNIGAKVKLLAGAAHAEARINHMTVDMTENQWSVAAEGSMNMTQPFFYIPTMGETGTAESPAQNDVLDFQNAEKSQNLGTSIPQSISYGLAFDLGAEYVFDGILDGLSVSAAVLDLGFISWRNSTHAVTADRPWTFEGFQDLSLEAGQQNSLNQQLEGFGKDLGNLFEFHKTNEISKSSVKTLACTVNIGAEYQMPFYKKLSVGILSTTRIYGPHTSSEGRFSLNVEPTNWFAAAVSYGVSSFGSTLGGLINFSLPGFGLFIGMDTIPLHYTPALRTMLVGLPYRKLNMNLNFGLNFNLSKARKLGKN